MFSPETSVASCSPSLTSAHEVFKVQMSFLPPPIIVSLISKAGSDFYNEISQKGEKCGRTLEWHKIISGYDIVSLANLSHTQETLLLLR